MRRSRKGMCFVKLQRAYVLSVVVSSSDEEGLNNNNDKSDIGEPEPPFGPFERERRPYERTSAHSSSDSMDDEDVTYTGMGGAEGEERSWL